MHIEEGDNETGLVLQTEHFSAPESGTLEYTCKFGGAAGAKFHILYDHTKMYAEGIEVSVDDADVDVADEGEGRISVVCKGAVEVATVTVGPKA